MHNNKLWFLSLSVSLTLHILLLIGYPLMFKWPVSQGKSKEDTIIIKPTVVKKITQKTTVDLPPPYVTKKFSNKKTIKMLIDKTKGTKYPDKKFFLDKERVNKITISEIIEDKELEKIPVYMDYYRKIREKIRRSAYKYYKEDIQGEVFLRFTLSNTGELIGLDIDKSKSTSSQNLLNIAVRSIKESAPFGKFPRELSSRKYISFNLHIFFKSD